MHPNPSNWITATVGSCLLACRQDGWRQAGHSPPPSIALLSLSLVWLCFLKIPIDRACWVLLSARVSITHAGSDYRTFLAAVLPVAHREFPGCGQQHQLGESCQMWDDFMHTMWVSSHGTCPSWVGLRQQQLGSSCSQQILNLHPLVKLSLPLSHSLYSSNYSPLG